MQTLHKKINELIVSPFSNKHAYNPQSKNNILPDAFPAGCVNSNRNSFGVNPISLIRHRGPSRTNNRNVITAADKSSRNTLSLQLRPSNDRRIRMANKKEGN